MPDSKMPAPPQDRHSHHITDSSEPTAIIGAEVVVPLDRAAAERLDKRIRLLASSIIGSWVKLHELVQQAKTGQIHQALGFRSWTEYVADAFMVQVKLPQAQRRELVVWLAGEGMSQRAIAQVAGVGRSTVNRDLDTGPVPHGTPEPDGNPLELVDAVVDEARQQGDTSSANLSRIVKDAFKNTEQKVTGRDGKEYPAHPERQMPSRRRRPLPDTAGDIAREMHKLHERITKLVDDDRFAANREDIACRIGPYDEMLAKAARRLHREINADADVDPTVFATAKRLAAEQGGWIELGVDEIVAAHFGVEPADITDQNRAVVRAAMHAAVKPGNPCRYPDCWVVMG